MTAQTDFRDAYNSVGGIDSAALQAKYALFLKELNGVSVTPLDKGLIYINRYLTAESTYDEATFSGQIASFSEQLQTYISTTDSAQRTFAYGQITGSTLFGDSNLFYPHPRTVATNVTNFTTSLNTDPSRFPAIISSAELGFDTAPITGNIA